MAMMTGTRSIAAALAGLVLALAAQPAWAQGREFWIMQFNTTKVDLNKAIDRAASLRDQLRGVGDNATGCRLSRDLRMTLSDIQIHSEKIADAAARLGDDDSHRAAVDLHNAALEERHRMESGILVQCANLGL
jgi:hypothetical protein